MVAILEKIQEYFKNTSKQNKKRMPIEKFSIRKVRNYIEILFIK